MGGVIPPGYALVEVWRLATPLCRSCPDFDE